MAGAFAETRGTADVNQPRALSPGEGDAVEHLGHPARVLMPTGCFALFHSIEPFLILRDKCIQAP